MYETLIARKEKQFTNHSTQDATGKLLRGATVILTCLLLERSYLVLPVHEQA